MKLLDAVNVILPYMGEATVTSTTARNSTVAIILANIEQATTSRLSTGLWFNTRAVTLYPDSIGAIASPSNIYNWYPDSDYPLVEVRGSKMWDGANSTFVFTGTVTGTVIDKIDFEELPEYAAQAITYAAALSCYVADFGADNTYQHILGLASQAEAMLQREHLRKKQPNLITGIYRGRYLSTLRR